MVPADSDLISPLIAAHFVPHARLCQHTNARTAAIYLQDATTLGLNATSQAATEAFTAVDIG